MLSGVLRIELGMASLPRLSCALLALMVEVDVEHGVAAVVPYGLGDGKVQEDHAFGGLAGADHGLAEKRLGGEWL